MSATEFEFATITKNRTNPAYAGARLGADRVAARFGASVRHYVPEIPDDVEQQIELVDQAISEKPDAVLIIPAHPTAMNATLRKIGAAGIPMFCFVSPPENVDYVAFCGSDSFRLATAVAERLFKNIGGAGNIVILEGHPNAPTTALRTDGFLAAAKRHPNIRVIDSQRGDYQFEPARLAMDGMLARHPRIDGVLAANDLMAMGAIESMKAAHRVAPIVGVNASPDAIEAIRVGDMVATAAFDAMKMACVATEAAVRHLKGESVPKTITLPAEVVDAANCAAWNLPYSERPLPDWEQIVGKRSQTDRGQARR